MKLSQKSAGNIFCLTDQKGDDDSNTVPRSYSILNTLWVKLPFRNSYELSLSLMPEEM